MPTKICCDGNCRQGRDCPVQPVTLKQFYWRLAYWMLMSVAGLLWLALLICYVY